MFRVWFTNMARTSSPAGPKKGSTEPGETARRRSQAGEGGLGKRVSDFCAQYRLDRTPSHQRRFEFPATGEWFEVDEAALVISKCSPSLGPDWKTSVLASKNNFKSDPQATYEQYESEGLFALLHAALKNAPVKNGPGTTSAGGYRGACRSSSLPVARVRSDSFRSFFQRGSFCQCACRRNARCARRRVRGQFGAHLVGERGQHRFRRAFQRRPHVVAVQR